MMISERERDRIDRRARREVQTHRKYSFARAGDLWVPRHCIGGGPCGGYAARGEANAASNTALDWPGADVLEAWYHWRFDRQYFGTLFASGTTPPIVTQSGTVPIGLGLRVEITTGGARGTAVFRWSADNGTNWTSGVPTAATVNLGNGVTLAFATGTNYSTDNVYILNVSTIRDQTSNAHHFTNLEGSHSRLPIPFVTTYGTGIQFDGVNDALQCTDTMGTNLVGGSNNDFTLFFVLRVESTTPTSGQGGIVFFGDGATNRLTFCSWQNATSWRIAKQNDALGGFVNVSGGTPNTSIHVLAFQQNGTTASIYSEGSSVVGPTAQNVGTLTVSTAMLGASFLAGSFGNFGKMTLFEAGFYRSNLDAATILDLSSRYRAGYGF